MKALVKGSVATLVALASTASLAANVALYSSFYTASVIPDTPHTTTAVTLADIESGALATYDVLVVGHLDTNDFSAQACTQLESFISSGGGVVTDWNAVGILFDNYGPNIYVGVQPQCGLFNGTVDFGDVVGTGTLINILDTSHPTMSGLPNPFSMGDGSEFFYTVSGFDAGTWSVIAEYDGNGGTWPAVMTSSALGGMVVVGTMDYFDVLPASDADAVLLINNMIEFASTGSGGIEPQAIPSLPSYGLALLAILIGLIGWRTQRFGRPTQ